MLSVHVVGSSIKEVVALFPMHPVFGSSRRTPVTMLRIPITALGPGWTLMVHKTMSVKAVGKIYP